jgi:hypothetical protein
MLSYGPNIPSHSTILCTVRAISIPHNIVCILHCIVRYCTGLGTLWKWVQYCMIYYTILQCSIVYTICSHQSSEIACMVWCDTKSGTVRYGSTVIHVWCDTGTEGQFMPHLIATEKCKQKHPTVHTVHLPHNIRYTTLHYTLAAQRIYGTVRYGIL